jgi:hypothetical protein
MEAAGIEPAQDSPGVEFVVCGKKRFHRIDWHLTAALRGLPAELLAPGRYSEASQWLKKAFPGVYLFQLGSSRGRIGTGTDRDALAVSGCGVLRAGDVTPLSEALEAGLTGCTNASCFPTRLAGDVPPLEVVDATGMRRAYLHAVDCEVCQHRGIARCEVFPKIARREVESDIDPRLDPEHRREAA